MDLDPKELKEISITLSGVKRVFKVGDKFPGYFTTEERDGLSGKWDSTAHYYTIVIESIKKNYKGEIFVNSTPLNKFLAQVKDGERFGKKY